MSILLHQHAKLLLTDQTAESANQASNCNTELELHEHQLELELEINKFCVSN